MITKNKPILVGILEPKQPESKIEEFAHKIGYPRFCHGSPVNTHIWLFWTREIDISITEIAEHITMDVRGDEEIMLSLVYAKCFMVERQVLWIQIRSHSNTDLSWLVGGDFSTILRPSEKRGGLAPNMGSIQDFHDCLIESALQEISYVGNEFSWCNNQRGCSRIWQRLDRVLCNGAAFTQLPELKFTHMLRRVSDHRFCS